ncbi:MAG: LEA type 2 family protein [Bacteroidetes bacterium]|nr:LEA type 2 family protein [Bacteroidota bacterium]
MKIKNILLLILSTIILSSCGAYKMVNIGDVEKVDFKGMVNNKISLELQVPVSNPNGYKLKIKSMDLDVTINGNYIGKMKIANQIIIPAKSSEIQVFPVDIYVKNVLAGMSSLYKIRNASSFEMEIDGTIKVKALLRGKIIQVKEKQQVRI